MDPKRFDAISQRLALISGRRQVLGSALGSAVALWGMVSVPEVAAKRRVKIEGPCGNGTIKDNRCKRNGQCCTGFCDKKKGKKPYGRCRCRKLNQSCQEDRNCCATAGQPMSCVNTVCVSTAPPPPTCPGLAETCTTAIGTPCCPEIDPNVVCSGGVSSELVCQDCTQPPTAAGAFCQETPGNQCCDGNPDCFVGVRVEDNQLACYSGGVCNQSTPCTTDADCGGILECAVGSANCGCSLTPLTFCGTPCSST